jgi:hypothetical protein
MRVNRDREDSGASYMPERYKQQIEARKRRQLVIRLAAVIGVVVVCVAVLFFLSGLGIMPVTPGGNTTPPIPAVTTPAISATSPAIPITAATSLSTASPTVTSRTPNPILSPALLAAQQETGIILFDRAASILRDDFPASSYVLVSADITSTSLSKRLYAFVIRPEGEPTGSTSTVYVDAVTGDPYSPAQENAGITLERAKNAIADSFTGLHPDRTRVRYTEISGGESFWNFTLLHGNVSILSGALDAGTGQIVAFSRKISSSGRPAQPVLIATAARAVADRYVNDQNGPVSVNMSDEQYVPLGTGQSPVAGQYVLKYVRLVQDYPCDFDGFTVSVDSVSGEVTGYERRWEDPDYAFAASPVPTVAKREATYTVLHKAQDTFPGLATGIAILSAEVRWKDGHPIGTVPRPGSIPLAWKVVFDDEIIRAEVSPVPAVAWVDVQSGSLLEFDYEH